MTFKTVISHVLIKLSCIQIKGVFDCKIRKCTFENNQVILYENLMNNINDLMNGYKFEQCLDGLRKLQRKYK